MSTLFVRTLREDPADAEVPSHRWLVRAGYIRRAAPGVYSWLPLGLKVLQKVETIVREEMDAIGAQEVRFPALLPREPYEATNRWTEYGPNLFRLQDRKRADLLLGPTHEEMFTLMVKDLYSSYKDLPLALYQIQNKYRDEARPRAGILRGREFVMKDAVQNGLHVRRLVGIGPVLCDGGGLLEAGHDGEHKETLVIGEGPAVLLGHVFKHVGKKLAKVFQILVIHLNPPADAAGGRMNGLLS